jgi:hypothetical protein
MTPFEQAIELYNKAGMTREEFDADLSLYAQSGYVLATPCEFAMARPVSSKWSQDQICYIEEENTLSPIELTLYHDCWYVNCVVGDLASLMSWLPYPLPYMVMLRRGVFKIYPTDRIT